MATDLRHRWPLVAVLAVGVFMIFWAGYGVGAEWGASQWGPLSGWFAGTATVGAISVALRESARSQRAREVDYELGRRRECLKALGEVWAALMQVSMDFVVFREYLDELPAFFNAEMPRSGRSPAAPPGESLGDEIYGRLQAFLTRWTQVVEPPLFTARTLLEGTPMQKDMEAISIDMARINNEVLPEIRDVAISNTGRRPDTTVLSETWKTMYGRRRAQLELATEHFKLDRSAIELAVREKRRAE